VSLLDLRHQGIVLLNTRITYYDGNPPPARVLGATRDGMLRGRAPGWTVVKHKAKSALWAKSTHAAATKFHRVKYQLVATHESGEVVKVTVWKCRARCTSEIRVGKRPNILRDRCWTCNKITPA
jgi:hypothetical protein